MKRFRAVLFLILALLLAVTVVSYGSADLATLFSIAAPADPGGGGGGPP